MYSDSTNPDVQRVIDSDRKEKYRKEVEEGLKKGEITLGSIIEKAPDIFIAVEPGEAGSDESAGYNLRFYKTLEEAKEGHPDRELVDDPKEIDESDM